MALKYKVGDVVVLGENVDTDVEGYFCPGAQVRLSEFCREGIEGEHYTVRRVDGKGGPWWVEDSEINHEATEALQAELARGYVREPISVTKAIPENSPLSDDSTSEGSIDLLRENAPQTTIQGAVEGSFASVYSSVSVFRKGSVKEGDSVFYSEGTTKITIDEDGGEFLVFQQDYNGEIQEIRLDFYEVDAVFSAAKKLMLQYNHAI